MFCIPPPSRACKTRGCAAPSPAELPPEGGMGLTPTKEADPSHWTRSAALPHALSPGCAYAVLWLTSPLPSLGSSGSCRSLTPATSAGRVRRPRVVSLCRCCALPHSPADESDPKPGEGSQATQRSRCPTSLTKSLGRHVVSALAPGSPARGTQ